MIVGTLSGPPSSCPHRDWVRRHRVSMDRMPTAPSTSIPRLPCGSASNAWSAGSVPASERVEVSIVVPVYNEEGNIAALFAEIRDVMTGLGKSYEVIFVDDGSKDRSRDIMRDLVERHSEVQAIFFRRNFGQTAAMAAGLEHAAGDVLMFMDADRQNDPVDIPKLLARVADGYDVVCGWRKQRKDTAVVRNFPSKIANWLIRKVSGVELHDLGCSLKAFRAEVIKDVKLYGEMHRFIPIYANAVGASITEIVVNHRRRVAGVSKYGLTRTFKVLLDLVTVKFLMTYFARPMHFFGMASIGLMLAALVTSGVMIFNKLYSDISMIRSPLLLLSAVLLILAVNFVLMGLLAEVQTRTYFESQGKANYKIKDVLRNDGEVR
jgi:glycosyltransferase involved in cell wall biosynthesis